MAVAGWLIGLFCAKLEGEEVGKDEEKGDGGGRVIGNRNEKK